VVGARIAPTDYLDCGQLARLGAGSASLGKSRLVENRSDGDGKRKGGAEHRTFNVNHDVLFRAEKGGLRGEPASCTRCFPYLVARPTVLEHGDPEDENGLTGDGSHKTRERARQPA
jgi:hypothetical protein